jgi:hypothetical protein
MKHKTAMVTAISVVTVLLAGAGALAANVGILSSTSEVGSLSAVSADVSKVSSMPIGPEVVAYQVAGIGVVTLSRDGDNLSLDSVAVGDWSYEVDGQSDGINIAFRMGDREVLFNATVDSGQTLVSVQEDDVIVQNSSVPGNTTPSFEDDDYPSAVFDDDESDDDHFENESSEVETEHEDDDD